MNAVLKIVFFIGLILVSPIIILFMVLIFIEDGLPTIFIQERLGKNMKKIKILKIRTMKNSTPNLGTHEINRSHYLKVGSLIRILKIDELPQILNFIKGDISIIGPRPCLPNQLLLVECRKEKSIFDIKPGITGLAQVLGYDMSNPHRLADIDNLYIKSKSIKLDFLIFLATFIKPIRSHIKILFEKELKKINDR